MKSIHMACDHAGIELKETLRAHLEKMGYTVTDHGTYSKESCDYPVFAHALCNAVEAEDVPGILICGTGIGMSIAANRHKGIRAALCTTELHARFTRLHNNANVLCLGARVTGVELALAIVDTFLSTEFEGGRHQRRIDFPGEAQRLVQRLPDGRDVQFLRRLIFFFLPDARRLFLPRTQFFFPL